MSQQQVSNSKRLGQLALAGVLAFGCTGAAIATAAVSTHDNALVAEAATQGWKKSGNRWWYQYANGSYAKGWAKIGGKWYRFDSAGWIQTGWQKVGATWYYLGSNGAMRTGWKKVGSTWYFFDGSGAMKTGWNQLKGQWYYHDGTGAMKTGWQKIGGKWYHFATTGAMSASKWVGNYYLQADGSMATSQWVGNYHVGADGKWDDTRKSDAGWKAAYKQCIEEYRSNYPSKASVSELRFGLNEDIDGNGIPELRIDGLSMADGGILYTYADGHVWSVPCIRFSGSYIPGENLFYASTTNTGYFIDQVYQLTNGGYKLVHDGHYQDVYDGTKMTLGNYSWDGEAVSESEYNKLLSVAFDGANAISPKADKTYAEIIAAIDKY